jgi:thioredoxin reductase
LLKDTGKHKTKYASFNGERNMRSKVTKINFKKINTSNNTKGNTFDVAIIGAGFAGLSAALVLGRYLRPAVIFDSGKTRNDITKHVHSYLGLENMSPRKFIKKAWKDVLQYRSIQVIKQKAQRIEKSSQYFVVTSDADESPIIAKYIILATGVTDIKPDIKNFSRIDGNGAWHCPHCDGLEAAGKKLTIIGNGNNGGIISYAKEFLGWTDNIMVFIQDNHHLDQTEIAEAKRLSIDIVENDPLVQVRDDRRGVSHRINLLSESGKLYKSDVIFYHMGYNVQSQLAEQLGCQLDEGFIKINNKQQTTVANVYAVGDVDTDRHYVVLAVASGALAAISIYEDILKRALGTDTT